jgi:hypothetical protein
MPLPRCYGINIPIWLDWIIQKIEKNREKIDPFQHGSKSWTLSPK